MAQSTVAAPAAGASPAIVYAAAFVVGAVLMGFEMLGSRYLYPYFGGGINTWAGLISTTLLALAAGYIAGGRLADAYPSSKALALAIGGTALYLAWLPAISDRLIGFIAGALGDGVAGILGSAAVLMFVPIALLGMLSPIAVRLLVRSKETSGGVAGSVYGISTLGNVFGTLFTTFVLIPSIGSRGITYLFTLVLAVCAVALYMTARPDRS